MNYFTHSSHYACEVTVNTCALAAFWVWIEYQSRILSRLSGSET